MEENKNYELEDLQEQEEQSALDFQTIYSTLILNWKWFLLSIVLCCALAVAYVKLAPKVFQSSTKILIKDDESKKGAGGAAGAAAAAMSNLSLGFMSSSNGIDNETEILNSRYLVQQTIKNLKLYAEYKHGGMLVDTLIYAKQEVNVDMDTTSLKQLNAPMKLTITREGGIYHVKGKYFKPIDAETFEKAPYEINKTLAKLPAQIRTKAGTLTLTQNPGYELKEGTELKVEMISPFKASKEYFKRLTMNQTKKTANTVELTFNDESRERGVDFLNGLIDAYNYQANIDKNEIQKRTEDFINSRLAKISTELTGNDTNLEKYKQKTSYACISEGDLGVLTSEVAPLVRNDEADVDALRFDAFMYGFMCSLCDGYKVTNHVNRLVSVSMKLQERTTIPQVKEKLPVLRSITDEGFMTDISVLKLEEIRCELRGLLRFLQGNDGRRDVVTHLADPITEVKYGVAASPGEDFTDYKMKVERWVRDFSDTLVVQKLHRNLPMTEYEFSQLERIFTHELGSSDDYERAFGDTPFGLLVRKLVKLDHDAAMEAFADFMNSGDLNEQQIAFVHKVVDYIVENGYMEPKALTQPPFDRPRSFVRMFNTQQQMGLVAVINKIKENAERPAA